MRRPEAPHLLTDETRLESASWPGCFFELPAEVAGPYPPLTRAVVGGAFALATLMMVPIRAEAERLYPNCRGSGRSAGSSIRKPGSEWTTC